MGGGLMQLVAYGAQDIYLTGNPQITFFKAIYRRHTNFAIEAIEQTLQGNVDFGNKVTSTISRNGDLIGRMYLEHAAEFMCVSSSDVRIGIIERYGHSLIKESKISIGGQLIDKHINLWNRVWSDLTEPNSNGVFGTSRDYFLRHHTRIAYFGPLTGKYLDGTQFQKMTTNGISINTTTRAGDKQHFGIAGGGADTVGMTNSDGTEMEVNNLQPQNKSGEAHYIQVLRTYLPFYFWFCRNPGLYLPIIALQYHEVKISIEFEKEENLIRFCNFSNNFGENTEDHPESIVFAAERGDDTYSIPINHFKLWVDYIYLDTDERRRFAQGSHEYLIEQIQHQEFNVSTPNPNLKLNFNHPIKEIIWTTRNETVSNASGVGGRNQLFPSDRTNNIGDYTSSPVSLDEMGGDWTLKFNGNERFSKRESRYFTRTQVWQHHTGYGATPTLGKRIAKLGVNDVHGTALEQGNDSISIYSFALKPEEHQPSGTCNFSRIDKAELCVENLKVFTLTQRDLNSLSKLVNVGDTGCTDVKINVFAVNYNVLRIMSGMAGLAYSN